MDVLKGRLSVFNLCKEVLDLLQPVKSGSIRGNETTTRGAIPRPVCVSHVVVVYISTALFNFVWIAFSSLLAAGRRLVASAVCVASALRLFRGIPVGSGGGLREEAHTVDTVGAVTGVAQIRLPPHCPIEGTLSSLVGAKQLTARKRASQSESEHTSRSRSVASVLLSFLYILTVDAVIYLERPVIAG